MSDPELDAIIKRCQRGTRSYDDANALHTDCFCALGILRERIRRLESGEFICTKCGRRKDAEPVEADF